jgi:hypothetical protein
MEVQNTAPEAFGEEAIRQSVNVDLVIVVITADVVSSIFNLEKLHIHNFFV